MTLRSGASQAPCSYQSTLRDDAAVDVRIWIDIENPPQVQYLLPFARRYRHLGNQVGITAQRYGITHELLTQEGVEFTSVGRRPGARRLQKILGVAIRTAALHRTQRARRPAALLCAGRSSVLAARSLGIPAFALGDYEYANLAPYRLAKAFMVLPDSVDLDHVVERGISRDRLIPYPGFKEDFTFAGVDLETVPAHSFERDPSLMRVLVRPAAEESHYHREPSAALARQLLEHLAGRDDVVVVFNPR